MSDSFNPFASPQADLTPVPGERSATNLSPELRQTRIGLTLVYFGIVLALFTVLLMAFGSAFLDTAGAPIVVRPMLGATGIALIVASIMMFVGPLFCLAVPRQSGARGYIVASVLLQSAGVLHTVISLVIPTALPPALALAVQLLGIVGTVLFILFMKKLADYIGRADISRQAKNLLIGLGVLVGLGVVAMFVTAVTFRAPPGRPQPSLGLGLIFVLAMGGFAVTLFAMYANLINALRKALRTE